MKKNSVFLLLLCFTLSLFSQEKKPNVILIVADDLGINALHCYGNERVESPNIDRLAKEGMRLTNGYASHPTCAPSRTSLITGQYIPRHKIYRVADRYKTQKGTLPNMKFLPPANNRPTGKQVSLSPEKITIADAMKTTGYATAAFGKCHFGSKDLSFGAHGFDEWVETTKHYNFKVYPKQTDIKKNEYNADYTTRRGIDFMKRKVGEEQPFFLYLPYYLVHKPLEPKPETLAYFKEKYGDEFDSERIKIFAMIKNLDESIGELLAAVDDLNIEEETIIIFTSDNGHYKNTDNFFNQPYRGEKGQTFEGGIRVPFIFKWKNHIKIDTLSENKIINIDLYPTILGMTETPLPEDYILDGKDISPLLLNNKEVVDQDLFWYKTNYAGYNSKRKTWRSKWENVIRSGDFKLTEDVENGTLTLFDLKNDPLEKENVAEKYPEKTLLLFEKLKHWKKDVGAETPTKNPDYKSKNL